MRNTVLYGNCLEKLKEVPDATKAAAVRAGERSICQWMLDGVV